MPLQPLRKPTHISYDECLIRNIRALCLTILEPAGWRLCLQASDQKPQKRCREAVRLQTASNSVRSRATTAGPFECDEQPLGFEGLDVPNEAPGLASLRSLQCDLHVVLQKLTRAWI